MIAALAFTVALLVTTTYFILGSIPLLVLKHDTPRTPASYGPSSTSTPSRPW